MADEILNNSNISKIKARIAHKHDTEAGWNSRADFVPEKGEFIIYDRKGQQGYEKLKIGDGASSVTTLPFLNENEINAIIASIEGIKSDLSSLGTTLNSKLDEKSDKTHTHPTDESRAAKSDLEAVQGNLAQAKTELVGAFNEHKENADIHFTAEERDKLAGISENANNFTYEHPATHSMEMIDGLSDALAGKASSDHTHSYNDLEDLPTINNNDIEITIDSSLSSTSTNPVQNKVIKAALDKKADNSSLTDLTSHTINNTIHITSDEKNILAEFSVTDSGVATTGDQFKAQDFVAKDICSDRVVSDEIITENLAAGVYLETKQLVADSADIISAKIKSLTVGPDSNNVGENSFAVGNGNSAGVRSGYAAQSNDKGNYCFTAGENHTTYGNLGACFGKDNASFGVQLIGGYYAPAMMDNQAFVSSQDSHEILFGIGNGFGSESRSWACHLNADGQIFSNKTAIRDADYAEWFEWEDGNPSNEDRRGRFVTLSGEKIRIANENDEYILGVVSTAAGVIGDSQEDHWQGRFVKDVYGAIQYQYNTIPDRTLDDGTFIPGGLVKQFAVNPDYNPEEVYIPRSERPEWVTIGLLGKIVIDDDGTCEVGKKCRPNKEGIATKSTDGTGYYVMSRVDESHIKVLVK